MIVGQMQDYANQFDLCFSIKLPRAFESGPDRVRACRSFNSTFHVLCPVLARPTPGLHSRDDVDDHHPPPSRFKSNTGDPILETSQIDTIVWSRWCSSWC